METKVVSPGKQNLFQEYLFPAQRWFVDIAQQVIALIDLGANSVFEVLRMPLVIVYGIQSRLEEYQKFIVIMASLRTQKGIRRTR